MGHGVLHLFFVSAVVMCISYTITKERIFRALREKLGGRETFLGWLFSCPYCMSHWVAFVIVPLTGAEYLKIPWRWGFAATLINWMLSSFLVVMVAAFLRVVFYFVDESQGLVRRKQKEVETLTEDLHRSIVDRDHERERHFDHH